MQENLAVLTTRQVIERIHPVREVYRDEDGDWQFMTGETVTGEDAKVVSLQQILAIDATLAEVLSLEPGYMAYRKSVGDAWTIKKE